MYIYIYIHMSMFPPGGETTSGAPNTEMPTWNESTFGSRPRTSLKLKAWTVIFSVVP